MAKSLFDPKKAAGAERSNAASSDDARPLTVSQASDLIKHALERNTPGTLRVIGQLSNLSSRNHWYFSLKDESAVLSCVAWATTIRKLNFTPTDGEEVIATGHLSHYGPQGKTQLYVNSLSPAGGTGTLELRFRALCAELRALGYFDDERKQVLPTFPRRIAVITSSGGAAVHDVINTAAQRCKAVGLMIVDVKVQGEDAAHDIAKAIRFVDAQRNRLAIDAILVTRGGGSIEDLWAFNEREVADAIFRCHLPIVAAIGHESDTTIAELVADVRASTPTQAAMRLVPASTELTQQVEHVGQRIHTLLKRRIDSLREKTNRCSTDLHNGIAARLAADSVRLERVMGRLSRARPEAILAQRTASLRIAGDRLQRAMHHRIDQRPTLQGIEFRLHHAAARHVVRQRERLVGFERQLAAVDPSGVLRRGYSITTKPNGSVVRSIADVGVGEVIATRMADGSFASVVSSGTRIAGRSRVSPRAAEDASNNVNQFDLFH